MQITNRSAGWWHVVLFMGWARSGKHMFGISRRGITDTCVRFVGVLALEALQGS